MVPADGVYAGWLRVTREPDGVPPSPGPDDATSGERLPAAVSVGTNPTFDGVERRVEAYVLDRTDLDLYDREVVLEFVSRVRPTLRFDSVEELVATMHDDVDAVRASLAATGRPAPAW
jgi:riboflavin kinase/FMN adenylyltransferase